MFNFEEKDGCIIGTQNTVGHTYQAKRVWPARNPQDLYLWGAAAYVLEHERYGGWVSPEAAEYAFDDLEVIKSQIGVMND